MSTRTRVRALAVTAGVAALIGGGMAATSPASAAVSCSVTYSANEWSGGFVASVTVNNTGDAVNGWTLTFNLPSGQAVTSAWNATVSASGSSATATNASYNGGIASGGNVSFGYQGTSTGSGAQPTGWSLNGTSCGGGSGGGGGSTTTTRSTSTSTKTSTTTKTSTSTKTSTTTKTTTKTTTTTGSGGGGGTVSWPASQGNVSVSGTIKVSGTLDGGMKTYCCIGDGGQSESQDAMFEIANGGTLKNVIIGAPAGDGVHCKGTCTIQNVWWNDVGEDAATFEGTTGGTSYVIGGGAKSASDKVFQHNGNGTVNISNFYVESAGKLYRACGNCSSHYQRNVTMSGVIAKSTSTLAGINTNWGDTARFSNITVYGSADICVKYKGVEKGSEPTKIGSGADGVNCIYSSSDITYK